MPRLEYFLVAESVSVDQVTNRVSIFNVVEQVQVPKFPHPLGNLVAVAMWVGAEGDADDDFQVGIALTLPGEKEPRKFPQNFRMPLRRLRTLAYFQGLEVKQTGTIEVDLSLNGEHRATHVIDVVAAEDQPPPTVPSKR